MKLTTTFIPACFAVSVAASNITVSPVSNTTTLSIWHDPSYLTFMAAVGNSTAATERRLVELIESEHLWNRIDRNSMSQIKDMLKQQAELFTKGLVRYIQVAAPCLNAVAWHVEDGGQQSELTHLPDEHTHAHHCLKPFEIHHLQWIQDLVPKLPKYTYKVCWLPGGEFAHKDFNGDGGYINWAFAGNYTRHHTQEAADLGLKGYASYQEGGSYLRFYPRTTQCARTNDGSLIVSPKMPQRPSMDGKANVKWHPDSMWDSEGWSAVGPMGASNGRPGPSALAMIVVAAVMIVL